NTADALTRLGVLSRASAVVSSDLLRASQTADIIAAASTKKLVRAKDKGFREINFGQLQGTSSDSPDSKALQAANVSAWLQGDLSKGFPDGEDGQSLMSRSLSALRQAAKLGEVVIVVAHGGMIRWSAAQIESGEAPLRRGEPFSERGVALVKQPVVNCSCSTVIYDHDSDSFHAEAWFADLQSVSQVNAVKAKDDSG
ncbi:gpmB, partial [Symbiodinium pilosum]